MKPCEGRSMSTIVMITAANASAMPTMTGLRLLSATPSGVPRRGCGEDGEYADDDPEDQRNPGLLSQQLALVSELDHLADVAQEYVDVAGTLFRDHDGG